MEMFARRNDYGVSVNESAMCESCVKLEDVVNASYDAWADAEDVSGSMDQDSMWYSADNEDAVCIGCSKLIS